MLFKRAIGYRIGIMGRINSADKSRAMYLTRKSVPRQSFDKNINFAMSQARARIGSFGVKI
jgi:ribosomal protein S3